MLRRFEQTVTSDASSVATAYTPYLSGYIHSIEYVKDATTAYTDGVDFTITGEASGQTIWTEANVNASKVCLPRAATHSNVGVATLFAAGGAAVLDKIALGRDRVKIVLAQAGASKVGRFVVTVDDGQ